MAIELKQQLRQTLQLAMTPQLQMAIKLLQLNRLEMVDEIRKEMVENPVLEEAMDRDDEKEMPGQSVMNDADEAPTQVREPDVSREVETNPEKPVTDFDWEGYLENYSFQPPTPSSRPANDELPSYEATLAKRTSLADHLLWQIRVAGWNTVDEYIGALIVGNLTDSGYLSPDTTLDDIARQARADTGDDLVEVVRVEEVLKRVQLFDPLGVASRDLRECLLIQAVRMGFDDDLPVRILEVQMHNLEKKNFAAIARELGRSVEQVSEAAKLIATLEPKPGRLYSSDEPQYITPDIYVYKVGDDFAIVLNEDGIPKLRISNYYRNALANGQPGDTKRYIKEKLRAGAWLIRSIYQRQRTIYRVTESILKFQRDFFEKGVNFLKPLILRDVAEDIGMHESTISRVTTNKYVHTPQGIFELKYFFNSSIARSDGDDLASEAVKAKIKTIIQAEDPRRPLSDQRIAEILKGQRIEIARRTIAKYREMMGVLPSSKRKRLF
ncbi:MAG: RNA polymerase factor sigma-54 [Deltaproteobacteria bacterium]|nr:RNA polymerase factor sigma-54 [Deltaproteobacteria bacterium]